MDCDICLDPLVDDVAAAPCGHVLHAHCFHNAISVKPVRYSNIYSFPQPMK